MTFELESADVDVTGRLAGEGHREIRGRARFIGGQAGRWRDDETSHVVVVVGQRDVGRIDFRIISVGAG